MVYWIRSSALVAVSALFLGATIPDDTGLRRITTQEMSRSRGGALNTCCNVRTNLGTRCQTSGADSPCHQGGAGLPGTTQAHCSMSTCAWDCSRAAYFLSQNYVYYTTRNVAYLNCPMVLKPKCAVQPNGLDCFCDPNASVLQLCNTDTMLGECGRAP